jgi:hypothetical protein
MPKQKKTILETDHTDLLDVQERYLHATDYMRCDGCGEEKAISKGVTYLEHIAHSKDGKTKDTMVFCPRCIFAIKARQAATREPFEIRHGDLEWDKLNKRFQAAWMRLRQRITKSIKDGANPNDAWHEAAEKLVDELGMRHLYERDLMVSKQAEKFQRIIADIDRENAKLGRRLKAVKKELEKSIDDMLKKRLALKNAIAKGNGTMEVIDGMLESIENMKKSISKI